MDSLNVWIWLSDPENKKTIAFIGGGLVIAIGGAWKAFQHFSEKPNEPLSNDVANSLNNLAVSYYNQGKYEQAEPLYQSSLAIREKILGKEHPDVASSLNSLDGLYYNQGKYAQAELLYQQSLSIRENALGKDHPDVASSYYERYAVREANKPLASISLKKIGLGL